MACGLFLALSVLCFPFCAGAANSEQEPPKEVSQSGVTPATSDADGSSELSEQVPDTEATVSEPVFGMADVEAKARALAESEFENPDGKVPAFLLDISYDQWRKIRFKPESSLWRDEDSLFEAQFFHPGLFYNRLVSINVVQNGKAEKLAFSPDMFEYGDKALADKIRQIPLDFSGFRLHFPIKNPDYKDEVAVFLGATYFRAVTRDSQYGLSGRGLAIDTALASGEEFPYFREFWLVNP